MTNSYGPSLDAFRTAEQRAFIASLEAAYRQIEAEAAANSAEVTATMKALATNDDLTPYEAPCGYCHAIRKMNEV